MNPNLHQPVSQAEDCDTMCKSCGKVAFADSGTGSLIDHAFFHATFQSDLQTYINFDTG